MAAGGITAAAVWVDILPSARNMGRELSKQARQAGQQTGKTIADETSRSISQRASVIGSAISR
ncbi:MAG: hypothetical protein IH905_13495, partial [Proteobacteria bacterium]|nr:hypothetical protein [Pseudomonadota bacterium]